MNELFPGSAQPIQTQMTEFYLRIDHKSTGWPSYLGPRRSLFQNLAGRTDMRTDVLVFPLSASRQVMETKLPYIKPGSSHRIYSNN
jgi:hypothetical protein